MELTGWGCTASDPSPEEDSLLTLSWASVALPPPTLPLPARKRLPAMPFKLSRDGVGDVDELVDAAAAACCCWGDPTNSPGLAANMVCACVERTCCQGRLLKGSCRNFCLLVCLTWKRAKPKLNDFRWEKKTKTCVNQTLAPISNPFPPPLFFFKKS